eukprot:s7751_g3.t1
MADPAVFGHDLQKTPTASGRSSARATAARSSRRRAGPPCGFISPCALEPRLALPVITFARRLPLQWLAFIDNVAGQFALMKGYGRARRQRDPGGFLRLGGRPGVVPGVLATGARAGTECTPPSTRS